MRQFRVFIAQKHRIGRYQKPLHRPHTPRVGVYVEVKGAVVRIALGGGETPSQLVWPAVVVVGARGRVHRPIKNARGTRWVAVVRPVDLPPGRRGRDGEHIRIVRPVALERIDDRTAARARRGLSSSPLRFGPSDGKREMSTAVCEHGLDTCSGAWASVGAAKHTTSIAGCCVCKVGAVGADRPNEKVDSPDSPRTAVALVRPDYFVAVARRDREGVIELVPAVGYVAS